MSHSHKDSEVNVEVKKEAAPTRGRKLKKLRKVKAEDSD